MTKPLCIANLFFRIFIKAMSEKYFLISKLTRVPFVKYKGNAVVLSEKLPTTYDEVVVGLKDNKQNIRTITTFRDETGQIVERSFDYYGKQLRHRIYSRRDSVIGEKEWVDSKKIQELTIAKRTLKTIYLEIKDKLSEMHLLTYLWDEKNTRVNHLAKDLQTGRKILSSVFINHVKNEHKFIEYPSVSGKHKPKVLSFKVNKNTLEVKKGSITAQNIKAPIGDEYLGVRAYDMEDARVPIAKYFIHKRKLDDAELVLNNNYVPSAKEKDIIAFYSDENGSINFNREYKHKSKKDIINTCAHEVEHAWQWYLHAIQTGGETAYTHRIYLKNDYLKDGEMILEASRYTDAIDKYVTCMENVEEYRKSLLEVKARHKGKLEEENYKRQGHYLRSAFRHIPQEFL